MIEQKFVDLYARGKKVNLLSAERSVVLTYALRILEDAGLSSIALKGGTCLRKVYFKDMARFSLDLDMVYLVKAEPSEAIVAPHLSVGERDYRRYSLRHHLFFKRCLCEY